MARPRRPPYFTVDVDVARSPKIAGLPSDAAKLGVFFGVWAGAKLGRPPGTFAGDAHWREVAGRFARYLPDYLAAGLLERAEGLCPRCRGRWRDTLRPGALVVHDWSAHQFDPAKLERDRSYEDSHPDRHRAGDGDAPVSVAHSGGVSVAHSGGIPTPISRVRAKSNVERRTSKESHPKESHPAERADAAALLTFGWPKVTKPQRDVLFEIADRHGGPEWAAEAIRSTPAGGDPLRSVMDADRRWQDAEARRIAAEESAWQAEKAADKAGAAGVFNRLDGSSRSSIAAKAVT